MKIDTHIHSMYSKDSITPLEDIVDYSRNIGLGAMMNLYIPKEN